MGQKTQLCWYHIAAASSEEALPALPAPTPRGDSLPDGETLLPVWGKLWVKMEVGIGRVMGQQEERPDEVGRVHRNTV